MAPNDLDSSTTLKFDFELDIFQLESIKAINTGNNVITIASTSAGKSVIAYHAISCSLSDGLTSIYTAPVKSLANQKYSDLCNMFEPENVGLITGDVSTNSQAPILVMTAEVLRNHMMMTSSPLLSRVKHVILDEAHYLGDSQRGVVWEQILISRGEKVRFVLLTATLPNGEELAGWVSNCTGVETHLVVQKKRPVPLRINAFSDTRPIEMIKDGDHPADKNLISVICHSTGILGATSQKYSLPKEYPYYSIAAHVNDVLSRGCTPLILFCLSRRRCVQVANTIEGIKNDDVLSIFDETSQSWDKSILESEQYQMIRELIGRGVGLHHSGIIPILRETVELLFSSGHLAVLVATETFAMGVNAPAKGVMFSSLVKWGGEAFRAVSTAEFMQMAGRAGRRGFDDHGDVFIPIQEGTAPEFILSIIETKAERLVSQMRISPWLILSCIATGHDPHLFYEKSFMRFQSLLKLEELKKIEFKEVTEEEQRAFDYAKTFKEIVQICIHPKNIQNIFVPGRLVYIKNNGVTWGWSSVIKTDNKNVEVIVSAVQNKDKLYQPSSDVKVAQLLDVTFPLRSICLISSIKITNPKTTTGMERASSLLGILSRIENKYKQVPLIKPQDLPFGKEKAAKLMPTIQQLYSTMSDQEKKEIFTKASAVEDNLNLATEIESIENPPEHAQIETLKDQLISLDYFTRDLVLNLKGRLAQCFKVEDPVPLVELLLSGLFIQISPQEVCIASSCFVESPPNFKSNTSPDVSTLWCSIKKSLKHIENNKLFKKPHDKLMGFVDLFIRNNSVTAAVKQTPGLSEGMAVRIIKRIREIISMFNDAAKQIGSDTGNRLNEQFSACEEILANGSKLDSSLYKVEE